MESVANFSTVQTVKDVDTGSLVLSNHSPVKEMLDHGIQSIRETGMLDVLISKNVPAMPKSFDGPKGEVLGGRQLGLVFFFYLTVVVGSAAVLILEVVNNKILQRAYAYVK